MNPVLLGLVPSSVQSLMNVMPSVDVERGLRMDKEELDKFWNTLLGFTIGDRVKYTVYGRKTPFYGNVTSIDRFTDGHILIYVEVEGVIVWCKEEELVKVKRRGRA